MQESKQNDVPEEISEYDWEASIKQTETDKKYQKSVENLFED